MFYQFNYLDSNWTRGEKQKRKDFCVYIDLMLNEQV